MPKARAIRRPRGDGGAVSRLPTEDAATSSGARSSLTYSETFVCPLALFSNRGVRLRWCASQDYRTPRGHQVAVLPFAGCVSAEVRIGPFVDFDSSPRQDRFGGEENLAMKGLCVVVWCSAI